MARSPELRRTSHTNLLAKTRTCSFPPNIKEKLLRKLMGRLCLLSRGRIGQSKTWVKNQFRITSCLPGHQTSWVKDPVRCHPVPVLPHPREFSKLPFTLFSDETAQAHCNMQHGAQSYMESQKGWAFIRKMSWETAHTVFSTFWNLLEV